MPESGYGTKFFVGAQGGEFVIQFMATPRLTRDEALTLAAWLVAMADPVGEDFSTILDAVKGS